MKRFGPWAGYGVVSVLFLISQVFAQRSPRVDSLDPPVVEAGQELIIRGSHFGNDPGNATLLIGGTTITRSQILAWDDQSIRIKILDSLGSGMVTVSTREGRSQGFLLANRADLPRLKDTQEGLRGSVVQSLLPAKVRPLDQVTLRGENLGSTPSSGIIYLPWGPVRDVVKGPGESSWLPVPVSLITFWGPKEIRFRLPEGATTGPVKIQYKNTEVQAGGLNVDDGAAGRVFHSRRVLSLSYSFDLVVQTAGEGAEIQVWVPNLPERYQQKQVQLLSESMKPAANPMTSSALSLYRFENLTSGYRTRVTRDFQAEIYAQEVNLKPELILESTSSAPLKELYEPLLKPDQIIPSGHPDLTAAAAKARGSAATAYGKANALYRWLLGAVALDLNRTSRSPLEALMAGKANNYELSVLFTALSRASQIPARLIGGYVITGSKSLKPHYWTEILLPAVGWIPVDVPLAAGLKYGAFPEVPDPKTYYFGNMDNRHLAVSEGAEFLQKTSARSQVISGTLPGSLQTLGGEALGNLENYSLIWHDMTVTGNY